MSNRQSYSQPIVLAATSGTGYVTAYGAVMAIKVKRSTGSPVITITDSMGIVVFSSVTVSSDTTYYPQALIQTVAGVNATALYTPFVVAGKLTITITSATNPSTIEVWIMTQ